MIKACTSNNYSMDWKASLGLIYGACQNLLSSRFFGCLTPSVTVGYLSIGSDEERGTGLSFQATYWLCMMIPIIQIRFDCNIITHQLLWECQYNLHQVDLSILAVWRAKKTRQCLMGCCIILFSYIRKHQILYTLYAIFTSYSCTVLLGHWYFHFTTTTSWLFRGEYLVFNTLYLFNSSCSYSH